MNPWILHVKKYALEHNLSYKDAMTKAKPTYKKIQGSGLNDYLKKVTKRLIEREKVEKIKTAERNKTYPTIATVGGRRGRPKGSKNKVKKGGNIFGDFKNSLASVGKTMDALNPIKQSHRALLKAIK